LDLINPGQLEMIAAPPRVSPFTAASVALLALLLAATLIVFGIRLQSVIRQGDLRETSGCEVSDIYSIWKARHGAPLYERPDKDPYSLTAYNAGFYYTYAAALRLLQVPDEKSLLGARLITLLAAMIGAWGQWILIRRLTISRTALARFVTLAVVVVTWFGAVVSWWSLSVRPDLAGVAMITWALAILARQPRRASLWRLLSASLLFTAAWTFKHSLVSTLGGCCLFMLLKREYRAIVALIIPMALIAGAMVFFGSDAYRFILFQIHRDVPFNWRAGPIHMAGILVIGGWYWALPLIVFLSGAAPRAWPQRDGGDDARTSDAALLVGCAAGAGFLFALLAMSKDGADRNHVFESLVASASLSGAALINLMQQPRRERTRLLSVASTLLLFAMLMPPLAQLAGVSAAGRIRLLTPDEEQRALELRRIAIAAPKPLYARDPMLSLPWIATNNQYPAFVLDEGYAYLPTVLARTEKPLLRHRILSHTFASLLLPIDDLLYPVALEAGYRAAAPHSEQQPILLIAPPDRDK
jgi:hypothetical protein